MTIPLGVGIDDQEFRDRRHPVVAQVEAWCDRDEPGVAVVLGRLEPPGARAVVGAHSIGAIAAECQDRDGEDGEPDQSITTKTHTCFHPEESGAGRRGL